MTNLTEILQPIHKKKEFCCGKALLDNYIHLQANQDIKRKLSACFVLVDTKNDLIKGYYTLSNNSIPLNVVPAEFQKKLPKSYTSIPTTLLGRLAVDKRYQRKGIGECLLIDALYRSCLASKEVSSFAVIVDPLDEEAENFYLKYGFIKLPDSRKMFLAMKTIEKLF